MLYFLQQALNGLQVSAFYALLAVGYVLVHAVSGRTNLAFGALSVTAGCTAVLIATMLGAVFYASEASALLLAVPAALAANAVTGYLLARFVVLPLAQDSRLSMLVATLGAAIVLEELARLASGSRDLWLQPVLATPLAFVSGSFPVSVTAIRMINLAVAAVMIAGLAVLVARHPAGRAWRAVSEDAGMARLLGIDVERVVCGSVVLGALYAGAAGILAAVYYGSVSFYLGLILGLKVLYVVVLGRLHSITGALIGAGLLGFLETFWSAYLPLAWRDVATFVFLTLILALAPAGLFAPQERPDHRARRESTRAAGRPQA